MFARLLERLQSREPLLAGSAIITTVLLMLLQQPQTGVGHDLVSFVAPIDGVLGGYSSIYGSFFNDTPPGIHTILLPWIWLFTSHPWSMYALHILLLILHQVLLFRVFRTQLPFWFALLAFTSLSLLAVNQDIFGDMLLTTELLGNVLIASSLLIFTQAIKCGTSDERRARLSVVGIALVVFAFWVREVYVYAVLLALVAQFFGRRISRPRLLIGIRSVSWGVLLGTLPVAALLFLTEGFQPYLFILDFKRELYPIPRISDVLISPLHLASRYVEIMGIPTSIALGILILVAIFSAEHRHQVTLSLTVLVLSGFAFAWQGKDPSGHYLAALLLPISLIVISASRVLLGLRISRSVRFMSGFVLLVPIQPLLTGAGTFLTDVRSPAAWWSEIGSQIGSNEGPTLDDRIRQPDCLQRAYGWAAGMSYRLNNVPPCSKYFLPNLIVNAPFHQVQYKLELLREPPSVVLYSPGQGSDLDVARFERTAMPWEPVIQTCFQPVNGTSQFAARLPKTELRNCMAPLLADQIFHGLRQIHDEEKPWKNLLEPPRT